jgi:hypothetical protein
MQMRWPVNGVTEGIGVATVVFGFTMALWFMAWHIFGFSSVPTFSRETVVG